MTVRALLWLLLSNILKTGDCFEMYTDKTWIKLTFSFLKKCAMESAIMDKAMACINPLTY